MINHAAGQHDRTLPASSAASSAEVFAGASESVKRNGCTAKWARILADESIVSKTFDDCAVLACESPVQFVPTHPWTGMLAQLIRGVLRFIVTRCRDLGQTVRG